jgi:hypothetical protein
MLFSDLGHGVFVELSWWVNPFHTSGASDEATLANLQILLASPFTQRPNIIGYGVILPANQADREIDCPSKPLLGAVYPGRLHSAMHW